MIWFVNILSIKVHEWVVIRLGLSINGYNPRPYIQSKKRFAPLCVSYFMRSILKFISKFTYLGVVFQTKGKLTGHFDHLRNKGIAAFAKVAARMPLSKMSPAILARLFLAVVLPSATYGLRSIHTNETLDFLDEVQGRLIKAWFGVSKYWSTSSLTAAIGWRKASEFHLSTSVEPKCILDPLLNPPSPARSFEA